MAQVASTCPDNDICFKLNIPTNTASSGSGNLFFQLSAPSSYEWVALGQGTSMVGSNIFVVYTSSGGKNVTISPRLGTSHIMPNFNDAAQVTLLDGSGVSGGKMIANVRCSNCDSWDGGTADFTAGSGDWIFAAHSSGGPKDSDDQSASIQQHDTQNAFSWSYANAKGGDSINPFVSSSSTSSTSPSTSPSSSIDTTLSSLATSTTTRSQPTTSNTHTNANNGSGGHSGLSSGAKAGIGIGVVMFVLLLVLFPFYVLRHHKQQLARKQRPHEPTQEYQKPELDGREVPRKEQELDGRELVVREQELSGRGVVANEPATSVSSELHGGPGRTAYETISDPRELADTARRAELSASPRPVEVGTPSLHSPQISSSQTRAMPNPLQDVAQQPDTPQVTTNSDQLKKLMDEKRRLEEQINNLEKGGDSSASNTR
ncbi:hypothetical protein BDV96DRAFT_597152 [Lophiotrema nucula]|uniref:DOMON domain-containing protein n=1 Tax=Lophiotrema nucula TaxID=690887 RepID=A0A6A5ZGI3_9PLEO|nr:hypothetical protein BDV96DRAFT_597152 [Lophiotrema nucula]